MATKGKRKDEGGSGAENKGSLTDEESREAKGPERGADDAAEAASERRREQIANNPDAEEEIAEEALRATALGDHDETTEIEDEAAHDRRRG
jgi:hypothetical protein